MLVIKAIYRNGKVEFVDPPPERKGRVEVLLVFPDQGRNAQVKGARFQGTAELDGLLEQELPWTPPCFIRRSDP